jgi:hypothetical protein
MNDIILNLYTWFAQFVPASVLKQIYIQPEKSRKPGYSDIEAETLAAAGGPKMIPYIEKFIFSINENFVSERIKNAKGTILFIEYGNWSVNHDIAKGVTQTLAITIAHNFSDANNDNLNEIILMQHCLETLDRILRQMQEEQTGLNFCANGELITFPVEIQVIDPVAFYGCGGYVATFTHAYTIL